MEGRGGAKLIKSVWKLPPPPSVKPPAFLGLHSSEGSFQGGIREGGEVLRGGKVVSERRRNGGGDGDSMCG